MIAVPCPKAPTLAENSSSRVGDPSAPAFWLDDAAHRAFLANHAADQFQFYAPSLNQRGGFHVLGVDGSPLPNPVQELHTTTRLIHSYSLAKMAGIAGADAMIDQGMAYLESHHLDSQHGGYVWALDADGIRDGRKLAYGHVFVLLAASSAKMAGHGDADRLIATITSLLDERFWEEDNGRFADEWNRDWTPFSNYRGMNANMHGTEALLAAYEATGEKTYLARAGQILDFFLHRMAPQNGWRIPEHYDDKWQIQPDYSENPMFRPAGTTPGHSLEFARLLLQHWDLAGRSDSDVPQIARNITYRALADAWDADNGGIFYTLDMNGTPAIRDRYWWPLTEAIGVMATLVKLDRLEQDEAWYRALWQSAEALFIDWDRGGWYPEVDADNRPASTQFVGKPDIYHSIQATLFPLAPGISRLAEGLPRIG